MINALFLVTALALPALGFTPTKMEQSHVTFSKFLKLEQRILLVGGNPQFVELFRENGLKAFGALTEDQPGVTPYHIVTEPKDIGFKKEVFQAVYWLHKNMFGASGLVFLDEATRLIQVGGYLLFDDEQYTEWPSWMHTMPWWDRMPFRLGTLVIYQKRKRAGGSHGQGKRSVYFMDKGRTDRAHSRAVGCSA